MIRPIRRLARLKTRRHEEMAVDLESLSSRVEKLERENRWLRRGLLAALLSAAPLAVMAQVAPAPPRPTEARQFTLLDSDNRTRASLEIVGNQPALVFYDGRGKTRVRLGLDKNGAPTLTAILPSGRDIELLSEWPRVRPLTDPDLSSR
jgi:hypothetical protein